MKFRYHRGSLEDSLSTEQDFNFRSICKDMNLIEKDTKMQIQFYAYDNRVDQALFEVSIDNQIIGFVYNE